MVKSHSAEGPGPGPALSADRARRPRGARGRPPPQGAGKPRRREALPVLCRRRHSQHPHPPLHLPQHHVPENAAIFAPPTSARRRRPARPRLYGAGWEAGGAAPRVPGPVPARWCPLRAQRRGLRRGPTAEAPRAKSEEELFLFRLRIFRVHSGHGFPTVPRARRGFSPADESCGLSAVPGPAVAVKSREPLVQLTARLA